MFGDVSVCGRRPWGMTLNCPINLMEGDMSTFDVMMDLKYEGSSIDEAIVACIHYTAMWNPEIKDTEGFSALVELARKKWPEYAHVLDLCCKDVRYTGVFIRE